MTSYVRQGTTVKYPCRRLGETGYVNCQTCGLRFTKLGLPRHWDHCKAKLATPATPGAPK